MSEPIFKMIYTYESKLNDLGIENQQMIFVGDRNKICLDFNNKRHVFEEIVDISTEEARKSIIAPVDSFYFVKDTCVLWRYMGGVWKQLTTSPAVHIVFENSVENFPDHGKDFVLYISENVIYRWDESTSTYIPMTVSQTQMDNIVSELKEYTDSKRHDVDTIGDLPSIGDSKVTYIVKGENKTYRWDDVNLKYFCIGSDYNDIEVIDARGTI